MQIISSKDNEIIKQIRKLKEKKHRDTSSEYLIEGLKLVEEAIKEKVKIKWIVICEDCSEQNAIQQSLLFEIAKYECLYVTKKVFQTLTDVNTPQGILAVIEKESESEVDYKKEIILALDGVQDPGNLGTIFRTADSVRVNTNYCIKWYSRCL